MCPVWNLRIIVSANSNMLVNVNMLAVQFYSSDNECTHWPRTDGNVIAVLVAA